MDDCGQVEKKDGEVIWQRDIPLARDIGITRCCQANIASMKLSSIISFFGLTDNEGPMKEIDADQARHVLETLLWKDMAYRSEIMPHQNAVQLSHQFIRTMNMNSARFFTNGDWYLRQKNENGIGWNSMTDSTFDGGIIAVDHGIASCIWFQDED